MKSDKILFSIILCFMLFSCANQDGIKQEGQDTVISEIIANNDKIQNKTTLSEDGVNILWNPNDEINVFVKGYNCKFISSNSSPATSATFQSETPIIIGRTESSDEPLFYGVYPFDDDNSFERGLITLNFPTKQAAQVGSFTNSSFPSIGCASGPEIAFYNIGGGIRFKLTQSGTSEITFRGNNGEDLAGWIKAGLDGNGKPVINEVTSGEKAITLTTAAGTSFETGKWYYITTLPTSLSKGFTMVFKNGTKTGTLTSTKVQTIFRSTFGSIEDIDKNVIFTGDTTIVTTTKSWPELPSIADKDGNRIDDNDKTLYYAYHMCNGKEKDASGSVARNYTVCYSSEHHCPVWVSAPRHSMYLGTSGRSGYSQDPDIPSSIQYNSKDTGGGCNKGHMLGSAERTCSSATNKQVFYYTNIAPQLSSTFNTGGGAWNNLEDYIDGLVVADTLYEVVGCYFKSFTDSYGETCTPKTISFGGRNDVSFPTMFYYALLRTKKGNTRKAVKDCQSSELQCVAFVLRHNMEKGHKPCASDMMSITDLEKITGFTYFPNVPNAPKSTFTASDWGK